MIRPGMCCSYKREVLSGEHRANHRYKLALYTDKANLSEDTEEYTAAGEVTGLGYSAGGITLEGFSVSGNKSGCLDFNDVHLPKASIVADGGLIYNDSLGGNAVAVVRFEEPVRSTNGAFDLEMPAAGDKSSLVRIA